MAARRYQRSSPCPEWVSSDLAAKLKRWQNEPVYLGEDPEEKSRVLGQIERLLTDFGMRKVWAKIEADAILWGYPSGVVFGEELFGSAVSALRNPPTERAVDVFYGGREASIARTLRHLVSPDFLDPRPAFYGYERTVLFKAFCDEALRVAAHFEAEAALRATLPIEPLTRSVATALRARFVANMAATLIECFGDASTAMLVTMANAVFPEQPIDRTTVDDYVKGVKALKIDGLSP